MSKKVFWAAFSGTVAAVGAVVTLVVYLKRKECKSKSLVEDFGQASELETVQ